MKDWIEIEEAFKKINEQCNYLILRNFEGFFSEILISGHNDIDLLCKSKKDRKKIVKILDAVPRLNEDNGIHYKFLYQGAEVDLDIRTLGDGYYDRKWQKNMLKNKKYHKKGFFVMSDEDYFYSLIYHAFYQKESLSHEYLVRLRQMKIGVQNFEQLDFERILLEFMIEKKYYYTTTYDKYVKLFFNEDLLMPYIKYPFEVKVHNTFDLVKDYIFGKINGAKIRFKTIFSKMR